MESHVKVLGILHIVLSSMGLLGALAVLVIFGGLAGIIRMSDHGANLPPQAEPVLVAIAGVICLVIVAVSLPGLIGGIGLLRLAPWSRILMIVISAIDLLNVPFGLALGIYGLWVLLKPETQALLDRRRYDPAGY
ncbi:MAG TPA: hypothetical protein VMH81_28255 [Bryobacteraceae bacterium]|nr:hypothetical protein [Bryobacteraceae bacterium]